MKVSLGQKFIQRVYYAKFEKVQRSEGKENNRRVSKRWVCDETTLPTFASLVHFLTELIILWINANVHLEGVYFVLNKNVGYRIWTTTWWTNMARICRKGGCLEQEGYRTRSEEGLRAPGIWLNRTDKNKQSTCPSPASSKCEVQSQEWSD